MKSRIHDFQPRGAGTSWLQRIDQRIKARE
jgi:hypothetical protein